MGKNRGRSSFTLFLCRVRCSSCFINGPPAPASAAASSSASKTLSRGLHIHPRKHAKKLFPGFEAVLGLGLQPTRPLCVVASSPSGSRDSSAEPGSEAADAEEESAAWRSGESETIGRVRRILSSSDRRCAERELMRCLPSVSADVVIKVVKTARIEAAFRFFGWLGARGFVHSFRTYHALIDALGEAGELGLMRSLFEEARSSGCSIRSMLYRDAMYWCACWGDFDGAMSYWEDAKRDAVEPSASLWTSLIDIHAKAKRYPEAVEHFAAMIDAGLDPSPRTVSIFVEHLAALGKLEHAHAIAEKMGEIGSLPSMASFASLMVAHAELGDASRLGKMANWLRTVCDRPGYPFCNGIRRMFDEWGKEKAFLFGRAVWPELSDEELMEKVASGRSCSSGENLGPRGENLGPSGENLGPSGEDPGPRGENPGPRGENLGPRGEDPGPRGEDPGPRGDSRRGASKTSAPTTTSGENLGPENPRENPSHIHMEKLLKSWNPAAISALTRARIKWTHETIYEVLSRRIGKPANAWKFFCWLSSEQGVEHDLFNQIAMLRILSKHDMFLPLRSLLAAMREEGAATKLSLLTFNLIIRDFSAARNAEAASWVFDYMKRASSKPPNQETFAALTDAFSRAKRFRNAMLLVEATLRAGYALEPSSCALLMEVLRLSGKLDEIHCVYHAFVDSSGDPDASCIASLIKMYCHLGHVESAMRTFAGMNDAGMMPLPETMWTMACVYLQIGDLEKFQECMEPTKETSSQQQRSGLRRKEVFAEIHSILVKSLAMQGSVLSCASSSSC